MSRSQSELSLTQREILQLVIYRTKNPKSPTFFGNNEYIGKCVNVKPDTVRKALKELKDFGYIMEAKDDKGRRHLAYTGKEFPPIIEDMRNMDKRMLKQEKDNYLRDLNYCKHELEMAKYRKGFLEQENSRLQNKLFCAELRVSQLENLLSSKGYIIEQINEEIKQAINSYDNEPKQPEVLPVSETPNILPKPQTQEMTANDVSSETMSSISDILKKLNPAKGSLMN